MERTGAVVEPPDLTATVTSCLWLVDAPATPAGTSLRSEQRNAGPPADGCRRRAVIARTAPTVHRAQLAAHAVKGLSGHEGSVMPVPTMDVDLDVTVTADEDQPWITLVLDDPVTSFGYVIAVLQKLFGFDRTKAEAITWQVHTEGRAEVFSGTREQAETACLKVLDAGLRSRYEQAGGR